MRRPTRTTTTLTALAAASTLLLAAGCGGGDDDGGEDKKNGDKIEGAGSTKDKAKPSPSPSEAGDFKRPPIKLPSDVHLVFDFDKPSDPDEAAASQDAAKYAQTVMYGITQQDAKTRQLGFYTVPLGSAQDYANSMATTHIKKKRTITGTQRYYRNKVTTAENGKFATVSFCANQSKLYTKIIESGKVLKTEPSTEDYLQFTIDMQRAQKPKGLWKAHSAEIKGKALQCKN